MLSVFLQVLVAWFYSHVLEWFIHKHVLHNKIVKSAFKHHFRYHHLAARRNAMIDKKYIKSRWYHWLVDDETVGLTFLALLHLPLVWIFPWAYGVLVVSAIHYFFVHWRAHRDVHWARSNLSHHYDHHMGPNQHLNWGVRAQWVDKLFKTRLVYKGTKREILVYKRVRISEKRGVSARSHRTKR